jgi:hypothetical protein
VLENLETYRQAESVAFLQSLLDKGLFPATGGAAVAGESLDERRARIEHMSPTEKEHIERRQERLQQLDATEQERLRHFDAELEQAPQAAALRQVMGQYHDWLGKLPAAQRTELLALDANRRVERIAQVQSEEAGRAARRLGAADVQVVARWIEKRITEGMPLERRAELQRMPENERRRWVFGMAMKRTQMMEPNQWLPPVRETDLLELKDKLSPEARAQLTKANTPLQKHQLFAEWARQAVGDFLTRSGSGANDMAVSSERLKQFFEQLPNKERNGLLELPPDELQMRLRRLYFMQSRPGEGYSQPRTFRPPGEYPPPPLRPSPR